METIIKSDLDDLFKEFGISSDDAPTTSLRPIPDSFQDEEEFDVDEQERHWAELREQRMQEHVAGEEEMYTAEVEKGISEADARVACPCKRPCMDQFDPQKVQEHIFSLREMGKDDKEMYIMGSLQRFGADKPRGQKRQRTRFRYAYDGKAVCKTAYCFINDVGERTLRNIKEHLSTMGPVPRVHGNKGRKPHNALKYEEVKVCVDFLLSFSDLHGLPWPESRRGHDEEPPILLPSCFTKLDIHRDYAEACHDIGVRALGLTSFKGVWQNCLPKIKIAGTREDVCCRCELLKKRVMDSRTEGEKLEALNTLGEHVQVALTEMRVYKAHVQDAAAELGDRARPEGPVPPLSTDLKKVHYTFDYCQNVALPHHSNQMGPLYFLSGPKVQIFGVRLDSMSRQTNYLIDEDQSIKTIILFRDGYRERPDGKLTHGPDAVISMLHDCLESQGLGEESCVLHADNCGGQNKNRYVIGYLCWRIHRGLHKNITLMMLIPGHTKCLVDGGFGHIKKLFRRVDCDSLSELASVVNKSASSNTARLFRNQQDDQTWQWYDWKAFLTRLYLPLKGIQKLHSFRFSCEDKGAVYVKEDSSMPERRVVLIRPGTVIPDVMPDIFPPAGLSRARQEYLYKNIRPYVRPQHQDTTCPGFPEE